jgi:hypothetical protein
MFTWLGPPGTAFRANAGFQRCTADASSLERVADDGTVNPQWQALVQGCADRYCSTIEPMSHLEAVGLFVQTRLAGEDRLSCVYEVDFSDIFPFLPSDKAPRDPP